MSLFQCINEVENEEEIILFSMEEASFWSFICNSYRTYGYKDAPRSYVVVQITGYLLVPNASKSIIDDCRFDWDLCIFYNFLSESCEFAAINVETDIRGFETIAQVTCRQWTNFRHQIQIGIPSFSSL